mmetsp:Transcript_29525/g.71299  ORF Transcript_29525/g.71299 Transcript_29525/m.71299 type:complete len:277 (+) Transcript_29525:636-1466(+)
MWFSKSSFAPIDHNAVVMSTMSKIMACSASDIQYDLYSSSENSSRQIVSRTLRSSARCRGNVTDFLVADVSLRLLRVLLFLLMLHCGCCGDDCGGFDRDRERDATGSCAEEQEEEEEEDTNFFPTARCSSPLVHPFPNAAGEDDAETTDDDDDADADGLLTLMVDPSDESLSPPPSTANMWSPPRWQQDGAEDTDDFEAEAEEEELVVAPTVDVDATAAEADESTTTDVPVAMVVVDTPLLINACPGRGLLSCIVPFRSVPFVSFVCFVRYSFDMI